ncbi:hypothetical protein ACSQ67_002928 [Phaseolus vulgaris]
MSVAIQQSSYDISNCTSHMHLEHYMSTMYKPNYTPPTHSIAHVTTAATPRSQMHLLTFIVIGSDLLLQSFRCSRVRTLAFRYLHQTIDLTLPRRTLRYSFAQGQFTTDLSEKLSWPVQPVSTEQDKTNGN